MLSQDMLHEFITANRDDILRRCRDKAALRGRPIDDLPDSHHRVSVFLGQLVEDLSSAVPLPNHEATKTAERHGQDLQAQGFTLSEVVHDYGDVCQAVTELAVELKLGIRADEFRELNRRLDDAIAAAVTAYGRGHDASLARSKDARVVAVMMNLRTAIDTASVALDAVKSGRVGIGGSTGNVLDMSMSAARALMDSLLSEYSDTLQASD
jgi:hypothetical protein